MQPSSPRPETMTSKVTPKATTLGLQSIMPEGKTEFPKKDNGSRPHTKGMTPSLRYNKESTKA